MLLAEVVEEVVFSSEADAVSFALGNLAHEAVRALFPVSHVVSMFTYAHVAFEVVARAKLTCARGVGAWVLALSRRGLGLATVGEATS